MHDLRKDAALYTGEPGMQARRKIAGQTGAAGKRNMEGPSGIGGFKLPQGWRTGQILPTAAKEFARNGCSRRHRRYGKNNFYQYVEFNARVWTGRESQFYRRENVQRRSKSCPDCSANLSQRRIGAGEIGNCQMSARSGFVELGVVVDGLRSAPIVSETYWGYVIRPAEPYLERAAIVEIAATFAGVLVFFAAYGHWLLPGSDLSYTMVPVKLVSTLIFAALGAALIWTGRQGMVQEMHVDKKKQEIRLVQRNRHGEGRLIALFAFGDVASVVLKRSKSPLSPARLSLRMARSGGFVDILPSHENELLPIRDRLIVDMSPRFRSDPPGRRVPSQPAAA